MKTPRLLAVVSPLFLAATAITGCAGPDITLVNPVVSGSVAPNRILKTHGYAEASRGLPVGSMTDEAILESLTPTEVCVSVSLHELSAIDLQTAQVRFTNDAEGSLVPAMTVAPPSSQTYRGLVPKETQTGSKLVCQTDVNGNTTCEEHPIVQTVMVPGPVEVFTTKGKICAPNANVITAATKGLRLDITTPTAARSMLGFGHGSKKTSFRWAFAT